MSFFDFFRKRTSDAASPARKEVLDITEITGEFLKHDYLGKAAMARDQARQAESTGNFDTAWGFYHQQKELYLKHAARSRFTKAQTLALDASVSEALANILRLEGKHHDALVHILYWVATSSKTTKSQEKKLPAYFNRCKFKNVTIKEALAVALGQNRVTDFMKLRDLVSAWRNRG